jgi:hypothetical protein
VHSFLIVPSRWLLIYSSELCPDTVIEERAGNFKLAHILCRPILSSCADPYILVLKLAFNRITLKIVVKKSEVTIVRSVISHY